MTLGTMNKELDLSATLYDLTEAYPELIDLLKDMGFFGVARPAVRNTLGRVTTLTKGCEKQGKNLGEVIGRLAEHGFTVKA
jgi:uncharacterized protein